MATTPDNEFDQRTHIGDEARRIVESMRPLVVRKKTSSIWAVALLAVVLYCIYGAPQPLNVVGAVAAIALFLSSK